MQFYQIVCSLSPCFTLKRDAIASDLTTLTILELLASLSLATRTGSFFGNAGPLLVVIPPAGEAFVSHRHCARPKDKWPVISVSRAAGYLEALWSFGEPVWGF